MLDVARRRYDPCLFGPNKIVDDRRKAQVLAETARNRSHFECHKGTIRGKAVVCAGYAEAERRGEVDSQSLRIARRLGIVREVDPDTGEP